MRIRHISSLWMTTISGLVVTFAFAVMAAGLFLSTSKQTITDACAGDFCIGQKKDEIDTVLSADINAVYENIWVSKPVRLQSIGYNISREHTDTYDYLVIGINSSWGREKHIRLKFKNDVLIEIDITHYGPLSVS